MPSPQTFPLFPKGPQTHSIWSRRALDLPLLVDGESDLFLPKKASNLPQWIKEISDLYFQNFRSLTSTKKALDMLPRIKRPRDLISLSKGVCDSLLLLNRVLDLTQLTKGAWYIPPVCKRATEPHLRVNMASNMPSLTKLVSEYFTLLKQASNILSLNEKTSNLFPRGLLEFLSQFRTPTNAQENLRPSCSYQGTLKECWSYHLLTRGLQIYSIN